MTRKTGRCPSCGAGNLVLTRWKISCKKCGYWTSRKPTALEIAVSRQKYATTQAANRREAL